MLLQNLFVETISWYYFLRFDIVIFFKTGVGIQS
jgi:hypothetical protein